MGKYSKVPKITMEECDKQFKKDMEYWYQEYKQWIMKYHPEYLKVQEKEFDKLVKFVKEFYKRKNKLGEKN